MQIPIHELKAGLSRYLQQARSGDDIVVTSHDKPIARIVGLADPRDDALQSLLVSKAASWSGRKPQHPPALQLTRGGRQISDIVLEDRG